MEQWETELMRSAKDVGVELVVGPGVFFMTCESCKATWEAGPGQKGGPARGWRKCPNGCNKDKLSD